MSGIENHTDEVGNGGVLVLDKAMMLVEIFDACSNKFKDKGVSLSYSIKEITNIIHSVSQDLRRHYPHIEGISGVKWAGFLCSAIHHKRPLYISTKDPDNSPQNEYQLNTEIAISWAIEIIERSYKSMLVEQKRITESEQVFAIRETFSDFIREALRNAPYSINSYSISAIRINPMMLVLMFEAFLEGRYPNVIKDGSSW